LRRGKVIPEVSQESARPNSAAASFRMAYSPFILVLGIVVTAFGVGVAVASNVFSNCTTTVWTTSGFLLFAGFGVLMIVEYVRDRHDLSNDGMNHAGVFWGRGRMAWPAVTSVRFHPYLSAFVLRTETGQCAVLSVMLTGIPEFARIVLAQVRAAAVDPETRSLLEATVADAGLAGD
jgi:hypothetical protein